MNCTDHSLLTKFDTNRNSNYQSTWLLDGQQLVKSVSQTPLCSGLSPAWRNTWQTHGASQHYLISRLYYHTISRLHWPLKSCLNAYPSAAVSTQDMLTVILTSLVSTYEAFQACSPACSPVGRHSDQLDSTIDRLHCTNGVWWSKSTHSWPWCLHTRLSQCCRRAKQEG